MVTLKLIDEGFEIVTQESKSTRLHWNELKEIVAFKLDLVTYDTVRIGFRIDDTDNYLEIDEDWLGYEDLLKELQRRFNLGNDWRSKVTLPPFETNLATIWSSEKSIGRERPA